MSVKDALHQLKLEISENENRKDFSFNEKMTWAKLLEEEYKKIAEINMKAGIPLDQNRSKVDTNKQVANDLDMGKETYRQAKYVSENATDDMIRELDAGKLSINKAFLTLKEEKEQLQSQLQQERNKLPKVIDNTDYDTINNLKSQLSRKDKDVEILKRDKDLLERKVKLNEDDAKKFNDLKTQIEFLNKEKEDIARQIQSATELSGLAVKIDHFLKTELSPIRYSRTLERMDSEVAVNNLTEIIESVESWCSEIREFLPNKNIINVEVIE
jgi:ParB family chromosome partitioning protein